MPGVQRLEILCACNSHICGVILQKDTLAYRLIQTEDQLRQRADQVQALQLERDEAQTCAQAWYTEVGATFHWVFIPLRARSVIHAALFADPAALLQVEEQKAKAEAAETDAQRFREAACQTQHQASAMESQVQSS